MKFKDSGACPPKRQLKKKQKKTFSFPHNIRINPSLTKKHWRGEFLIQGRISPDIVELPLINAGTHSRSKHPSAPVKGEKGADIL